MDFLLSNYMKHDDTEKMVRIFAGYLTPLTPHPPTTTIAPCSCPRRTFSLRVRLLQLQAYKERAALASDSHN